MAHTFKGGLLKAHADIGYGSPGVDQDMQCFSNLLDFGPFGSSNDLFHGIYSGKYTLENAIGSRYILTAASFYRGVKPQR